MRRIEPGVSVPTQAELQAFCLGKLPSQRLAEVESYVAMNPDCIAILDGTPDDDVVRQLRGAGDIGTIASNAGEAPTLPPYSDTAIPALGKDGTVITEMPDEPAKAFANHPRYQLVRKLGDGGMGSVFLAEHRVMQRQVAVKVIRASCLNHPQSVERFRREVKAAARLNHPNIVTAHDADEASGTHFLVMEYVAGVSLRDWLAEHGPLPWRETCNYIRQAALGLQYAHERGMVHRDLKPHNLMRTPDGTVKILDFGLARFACESETTLEQKELTGVGMVMGTADYMAPEQAQDSRTADIRADIYSLGCTFYQLLADRVPFPEGTFMDKIIKHTVEQPAALDKLRPDLPPGLLQVIKKMMAKVASDRYQTPAEVAAALEPFTHEARPPRRRWLWPAVAAGLLLVAAILGGVIYRIQTDTGELVITTLSDDVEVVVKQGGKIVKIIDTKLGKSIELRSGEYELELKNQPGLKLDLQKATLKRGEVTLATVEKFAKGAVPLAADNVRQDSIVEVRKLIGHTENVLQIGFLKDGKSCFAAGESGRIICWDVETGQERFSCKHDSAVQCVVCTPDGRHLISGSLDRTVRCWDAVTGKEVRKFDGVSDDCWGLTVSPKGDLVIANVKDKVLVWDFASGKQRHQYPMHATALGFLPDGDSFLAGGETLKLWPAKAGAAIRDFDKFGGWVNRLAISPDGRFAATAHGNAEEKPLEGDDCSVRIWDITTGRAMHRLTGPRNTVSGVAFAAEGKLVLGADYDGSIRLWEIASGKQIATADKLPPLYDVTIGPDGVHALSGGAKGDVRLWRLPGLEPRPIQRADIAKASEVRVFRGHTSVVNNLAISADGKTAVSVSSDWDGIIWDMATGAVRQRLRGSPGRLWAVAISPNGKFVATGGEDQQSTGIKKDFAIRIWDAEKGEVLRTLKGHTDALEGVVFTDNEHLISCNSDGSVRFWSVATGKEQREPVQLGQDVSAIAPDRAGKRLAAGLANGSVVVLNLADMKPTLQLPVLGDKVYNVVWLNDNQLAVAGTDPQPCVIDIPTKAVRRFVGHTKPATGLDALPGGQVVVTSSRDWSVRVWSVADGKELAVFTPGCKDMQYIKVTPDGRQVLAGGQDGTLRLWQLPAVAVAKLPTVPEPQSPTPGSATEVRAFRGHTDSVECIAFTPDGKTAVSVSQDRTGIVWDLETGSIRHRLGGHPDSVWAVAVSPDGKFAVTGGQDWKSPKNKKDERLRVWDLQSGSLVRTLAGHSDTTGTGGLAFLDNKRLISGNWDGTVRFWSVDADTELRERIRRKEGLSAAAPDATGKLFALGTDEGEVLIQKLDDKAPPLRFKLFAETVERVVWVSDHEVAVAGADAQPALIDVNTKAVRRLAGHSQAAAAIDVLPGGQTVITGGTDGQVKLWSVADGKEIASFHPKCDEVPYIKVHPDGRQALIGGGDGSLRLWQLPKLEKQVKHPHLHRAVQALRDASGELRNAPHNFGGHKAKALDALNSAAAQLEKALVAVGDPYSNTPLSKPNNTSYPDHPHLRFALQALRDAHKELADAKGNLGGQKKKAMDDLDIALDQVKKCLDNTR